ncbi:MAG: hypothetical protein PGN27_05510 [Mycolicibacterium neoaurum]|uniref:DUF7694 domain-containing protein n=1 Tax=Mycolicibacterium neoaurum TaxID=1795 RepID=UPI002FFB6744
MATIIPTTVPPLRLPKVMGRHDWHAPREFGPDGWKMLHTNGTSSIIVTADRLDAVMYIHASIAHNDTLPTYDELGRLHRAAFGDGYAYQVFAPAAQHVNTHQNALHLWGRADGLPCLPEFGLFGTI